MQQLLKAIAVVAVVVAATGCEIAPPEPYDPAAGGWTLVEENDFSTSVTNTSFPNLIIEGDAEAIIENGQLKYVGDSSPDDKIWLRTDYGYTNTDTAYKLYVEPKHQLGLEESIIFFMCNRDFPGKIGASIDSSLIGLRTLDGPADQTFGDDPYPQSIDYANAAFELIIDGSDIECRLIMLDSSRVMASVTGVLTDLSYYDGHDVRLRLDCIGTVYVDNLRIYTKEPSGT